MEELFRAMYARLQTFSGTIAALLSLSLLTAAEANDTPAPRGWSASFSTYSWLPWLSGDIRVDHVDVDVDVSPDQLLRNLDWSTMPVWMSYGELRNGRLTLFNDIVWTALEAADGFERRIIAGSIQVDYKQLTVELGAAYQIWANDVSSIDLLAGGRYWRQETDIFSEFYGRRGAEIARSGSVDWVDPFIGARLQQAVAPGQSILIRGDVGGFGAGSDFSWQAMATFNMELCVTSGYEIDGYLGYRALSVDYSEGSYEYDAVQHGPILGVTMKF